MLLALGALLPTAFQWSISSVADDVALEFSELTTELGPSRLRTSNSPIHMFRPAATAELILPASIDPLDDARRHFRGAGLTLAGSEPERWMLRPNENDGAVWHVGTIEGRRQQVNLDAADNDGRVLFPALAFISMALLIAGGALLSDSSLRQNRQVVTAGLLLLPAIHINAIVFRAAHQAKLLIESYVAAHGPLPEDGGELAALYGNGTAAEQLLARQLGVVDGLYPFGPVALVAAIIALAAACSVLPISARNRACLWVAAAVGCVASIVVYGSSLITVVNILE